MKQTPFTTLEYNALPERAQNYIRQLEVATRLLKDAVAATANENKNIIHKRIDLWDILTGAATTSILNNAELRDEASPLVDADNIHLFPDGNFIMSPVPPPPPVASLFPNKIIA